MILNRVGSELVCNCGWVAVLCELLALDHRAPAPLCTELVVSSPNYFGEWLVWVALALGSVPALRQLLCGKEQDKASSQEEQSLMSRAGAILSVLSGPASMYVCLVHWTGATPAEFFSLRNRPSYAKYAEQVNCFFPGPRRVA